MNKKLSREDIAKIEIGQTTISKAQKWFFILFFLLFISIYPICQMFYIQPFGEWKQEPTLQKSIKAYETSIEETSLLRKWLLTPAQQLLTEYFGVGNEKVIIGKDGWLFFSGDYEYLINTGFMLPEKQYKRSLSGVQPDPLKAILAFNAQLKERDIELILLPIPVKPMVYPDKLGGVDGVVQNPSWESFKNELEANDITVIDLLPKFAEMRENGIEPYLKTDTHWSSEGMAEAATIVAKAIDESALNYTIPADSPTHTSIGDIALMLKLENIEDIFPQETVKLLSENYLSDRSSDVLLLGDSFTNIYSVKAMNWGTQSGFAEHLAARLERPIDVIARNDAGAFATRQLLSQELRRGRDRLADKSVVVWEFAIRELANGDWKMLDMSLGEAQESELLEIEESRSVEATILAMSELPTPGGAPYKDHIISLHLGDIDGGNDQVLVYIDSMRDNQLTKITNYRPGDKLEITLEPWEDFESEYGSWNRSEFYSDELILALPCWGELK